MKNIFNTYCSDCKKKIKILVAHKKLQHGCYTCNECIPKNSSSRNDIDEAYDTEYKCEY